MQPALAAGTGGGRLRPRRRRRARGAAFLHGQRPHVLQQRDQGAPGLFPGNHVRRALEPHPGLVRRAHLLQPLRGRRGRRGPVVPAHEHHHGDRELADTAEIHLQELVQQPAQGEHVAGVDGAAVGVVVVR